jgi:hypothetical protein
MGLLKRIFPPPPEPPDVASAAPEGALDDVEQLAIFLACSCDVNPFPANRVELLDIWNEHEEKYRTAYRRRARRLLATWGR